MKNTCKIILLISIFIFSAFQKIKAQGNLQFNQVKYYELSVTQVGANYTQTDVSITVPAGKVWKIESAVSCYYVASTNLTTVISFSAGRILLNGKTIFEGSGGATYYPPLLPLWLPAGTYTLTIKTSNTTAGSQNFGHMSAIEFNVVP